MGCVIFSLLWLTFYSDGQELKEESMLSLRLWTWSDGSIIDWLTCPIRAEHFWGVIFPAKKNQNSPYWMQPNVHIDLFYFIFWNTVKGFFLLSKNCCSPRTPKILPRGICVFNVPAVQIYLIIIKLGWMALKRS